MGEKAETNEERGKARPTGVVAISAIFPFSDRESTANFPFFCREKFTALPMAHSEHQHLIFVLRFEILQMTNHFIYVDMSSAHTVVERSMPPFQVVRCAGSEVCGVIP